MSEREIQTRMAGGLMPSEVETLIAWRDYCTETLVEGLPLSALLNLYHASADYFTLQDWLADGGAQAKLTYKLWAQKRSSLPR